jgi:hypothetical protein
MPKRKLAVVLASSMGLVVAVNVMLAVGLAIDHKPYVLPLASLTACIPGFVVAGLAWRGRLTSRCGVSH